MERVALDSFGEAGRAFAAVRRDVSWPGANWPARAHNNLDQMMLNRLRRADEIDEAVCTVTTLDVHCSFLPAKAARQRAVGRAGLRPPRGTAAKLALLDARRAGDPASDLNAA